MSPGATGWQDKAPALAQRRGTAGGHQRWSGAAVHQVLMGDFELTCADGQVVTAGGSWTTLTAGTTHGLPTRWTRTPTGAAVARPERHLARPSHRHGGMRYELRRQSARVQLGRGAGGLRPMRCCMSCASAVSLTLAPMPLRLLPTARPRQSAVTGWWTMRAGWQSSTASRPNAMKMATSTREIPEDAIPATQ